MGVDKTFVASHLCVDFVRFFIFVSQSSACHVQTQTQQHQHNHNDTNNTCGREFRHKRTHLRSSEAAAVVGYMGYMAEKMVPAYPFVGVHACGVERDVGGTFSALGPQSKLSSVLQQQGNHICARLLE